MNIPPDFGHIEGAELIVTAAQERARIVAWLRRMADETHRDEWRFAAEAIERGEHE